MGRVRILDLLVKKLEMNVTAIAKKTGLNHSRVKIHLQALVKMQIIEEKRFGRIKIYKMNEVNRAALKLQTFLKSWDENDFSKL